MGQTRHFEDSREPQKLQMLSESENENDQKEAAPVMKRTATIVVHSAKRQVSYIVITSDYFAEYIST